MRLYQNTPLLILLFFLVAFFSMVLVFDSKNNTITGNTITKVEVFQTQSKNCSFHLYPGWNMVSFYCLGMFAERGSVLQSLDGFYGPIFEYQSNDLADPWKSYNADLPNWTVQQLNYMDRVSGYWIYMYNDADFNYAGVYSDSIIYIYNGWNFVGYPNTKNSSFNASLNNTPFTVIKYYNTTNDTWLIYYADNISGSSENFSQFETYKGYWINASGDSQWVVAR